MTDGREEPSASYKLGNGWVILHWCANLTIILYGFHAVHPSLGSTRAASQTGRSSSFGRLSKLQCSRCSGHGLAICGHAAAFYGELGFAIAHVRPVSAGIAWYFAAHAIVLQPWVYSGSLETIPSAALLSVASAMGFLYIVDYCRATLPRPISGSMPSPDLLSPPLWCSFPIERFPLVGSGSLLPGFPCGTSASTSLFL